MGTQLNTSSQFILMIKSGLRPAGDRTQKLCTDGSNQERLSIKELANGKDQREHLYFWGAFDPNTALLTICARAFKQGPNFASASRIRETIC